MFSQDIAAPEILGNLRQSGISDNADQYQTWLDAPAFYRQLILGTLSMPSFDTQIVNDPRASVLAYLYATGRCAVVGEYDQGTIIALSAAEIIAPMIPNTIICTQEQSREIFVTAVQHVLHEQLMNAFCAFAAVQYTSAFAVQAPAHGDIPAVPPGPMRINFPQLLHGLPAHWPLTNAEILALNPHQAMALLIFFSQHITIQYSGLSMLTTTYIAIIKRGQATPASIRKIQDGIRADLGIQMTLTQRAITSFYSRFIAGINDVTIQPIPDHWETLLPPEALRLRLTVQEVTGSGLTVVNIIEQALQTYPNFPWPVLVRLFPSEMNSVQTALTAIAGNPYYGFRKDLGPIRSTLYKNVGYVAKELLVKGQGNSTLEQHRGWPAVVPQQAEIDHLIDDFLRSVSGNIPLTVGQIARAGDIIGQSPTSSNNL